MPPSGRSPPQRPRHITASTHVLATRLMHNTVKCVTVGNTPLHVLHLCDVQCVAPLFASCVSLTTMTIHLKYLASSTALEMLLRAAAASPTLTHISVIGGVTSMEAAAMASGISAFTWSEKMCGQRVSCTAAPSESPLPRTARRVTSSPEGHLFLGGQGTGRGGARGPRYLAANRSAAPSPYVGTPPLTNLRRQRCAKSEHGAPPAPSSASSRSAQRRLREGGAMWPASLPISPLVAPLSHRTPLTSSQSLLHTPPPVSPLSTHCIEGGIYLTLELHRLEEATAALLLDGLRRAHRIISAEVRLCVATAQARRAGRRLAHAAKKAVSHHRQRRLLFSARSVAGPVARHSCSPQAREQVRDGETRRRQSLRTNWLRLSPRPGLRASGPPPTPAPLRPPASPRPLTPTEAGTGCTSHGGRRPLLSVEAFGACQQRAWRHEQRLAPRGSAADAVLPHHNRGTPVQPQAPLTPSPSSASGASAHVRAQRPTLCASERAALRTRQADVFCRRGRYASPPFTGVDADAFSCLASPRRHLARAGRLYSPPRWASRAQQLTNGAAPPPLPLSKLAFCSTLQSASARNTSSPAKSRLELRASSWSSWSSRTSSPPPRPPHPLPRRADEAFANVAARAHATEDEKREPAKPRAQRTPPGVASAPFNRRGLRRLITSPTRQPHSPPFYPSNLCSPRYCLHRASDGLTDEAAQRGIPAPQMPPYCSPRPCSCFVCGSRPPSSPVACKRPARPSAVPSSLENATVSRAAAAVRALRPRSSSPYPYVPFSAPSSPASSPAAELAARKSRPPYKHDEAPLRERRDAGDVTPTSHSAATSVNGITPSRRRSRDKREADSATASLEAVTSAPSSSKSTFRGADTPAGSARRSMKTDLKEGNHSGFRHSAARARMNSAASRCQESHFRVSHTQLPPSLSLQSPEHEPQRLDEEAGYVVYPNSLIFLRARVAEINRHVVWHQIQSSKAAEAHSRRLAELEVTFSDRVTEELTDVLMVLTDMEHGSRVNGQH
ncbi:hypothetical protein GH5_03222 [Leishmania sp. Ghana 2012 LV757]|uniref:hypothetical protein n=1 Tax=Leishmania sp. Ghana 2012 LV757 TaxID=2803181 RepID=UPI001B516953|nr:hypothetical protein GH5_03222 [Leishmania sp. Ghana 2012 LV757]